MNTMQQQSPFEWMKFIKTDGEKHVGIAVIRYDRRFIFRFKVMPSDHGGYWITTASLKMGSVQGKDKYEPAFSLDSEYEKSQMTDFILECVNKELEKTPATSQSIFGQTQNAYGQQQTQNSQQASQGYGSVPLQAPKSSNDENLPF